MIVFCKTLWYNKRKNLLEVKPINLNLSESDIKFLKTYYECNMSQRLTAKCLNCTFQNITYYLNKITDKVKPLNPRVMQDLLIIMETIDNSISKLLTSYYEEKELDQ